MDRTLVITILTFIAATAAEPLVLSSSIISSPLTSAALIAPAVSPVAQVAPVGSALPAPLATVPFVSVSDYRYSYGPSSNLQDYLGVPAVPLPYTLPYTLTDLYYR